MRKARLFLVPGLNTGGNNRVFAARRVRTAAGEALALGTLGGRPPGIRPASFGRHLRHFCGSSICATSAPPFASVRQSLSL